MSSSNTYSMSELLDQTVERLPYLRRKVAQFRLKNKKYRERLLDELTLKCCDDPEASEILSAVTCSGLLSGTIAVTDKFNIDPDKLERLFQILIEYLPKLLEIILPLFMQTILFILAFSLLGSAVNAQQCDPQTGQCHPVKNALSATLSAIGDAITPDCACGPNCQCNAVAQASQDACCQPPVSSPPVTYSSSQTFYVASAPVYSASRSWSKSWHRVDRQPLRNFGRRILGR